MKDQDQRLRKLLDAYSDATLSHQESTELEHRLLISPQAREEFWKHMELHTLLRQWGQESTGFEKESARLDKVQEQQRSPSRRPVATRQSHSVAQTRWALFWLATFLFAITVIATLYFRPTQRSRSFCILSHAENAQWVSPAKPVLGLGLPQGRLILKSGLAELTFDHGAIVAMEGPAEVELLTRNQIILRSGKMGAMVSSGARGFTVQTPAGKVVDLGTRFGLKVTDEGITETHVFEGHVELVPGESFEGPARQLDKAMALSINPKAATATAITVDPEQFPQPTSILKGLMHSPDFEPGDILENQGRPQVAGKWSGDTSEIAGPQDGIEPHSGKGMLRFLRADSLPQDEPEKSHTAEQWQVIDLRAVTGLIAHSQATAVLSAWFNCAARQTNNRFKLEATAYRGQIAEVNADWDHRNRWKLTHGEAVLNGDTDPMSWQRVEVTVPISRESGFLLVSVQVHAAGTPGQSLGSQFVDSMSLEIRVPPHTSLPPSH